MSQSKKAFTMIELVFVIVILGILSAVAIPQFTATKKDAEISKGRADVASVRSAIITERQSRLITGDSSFIAAGTATGKLDSGGLFGGVLTYPVTQEDSSGHWHGRTGSSDSASSVKFKVDQTDVTFTYTRSSGIFTCDRTVSGLAGTYCKNLID